MYTSQNVCYMGQNATLEQIKFIETQLKLGKPPREIIALSDLTERTVRKYISILRKTEICFLFVAVRKLERAGVLMRMFDLLL